MTFEPLGRSLSDFTVELDVYSGPYEWLLALILKDELEIFEVPLRELVESYLVSREPEAANALERDTDFAGSAAALVLLKSRTLSPAIDAEAEGGEDEPLSPEELADRLAEYLKIRRGAEHLRERFTSNAGHFPSAHTVPPRPGRLLINPDRVSLAARRAFSRLLEPPVRHLGPITVTLQELARIIRTALISGPVSYESLTGDMDRLNKAVAFAAALSLAQEGSLTLSQTEPLGPLMLEPSG
ncbi:MAG TPA: segregation/condensation protein A [Rubrobacter sp.]|nr:segregation/condensation protein A [Rubrobacter sp.]